MVYVMLTMYTFLGQLLACASPSQQVAAVLAAGLGLLFNVFNGYTLSYASIPEYWQWANRCAPCPLRLSLLRRLLHTTVNFPRRRVHAMENMEDWFVRVLLSNLSTLVPGRVFGARGITSKSMFFAAPAWLTSSGGKMATACPNNKQVASLTARFACRCIPTTWVIYGLTASQLGANTSLFIRPDGTETTVAAYMEAEWGYSYDMRWTCIAIVFAFIVALRVFSIIALKTLNYQIR